MTIKIEDKIPLPEKWVGVSEYSLTATLRKMKVGQSFIAPNPHKKKLEAVRGSILASARQAHFPKSTFATRTVIVDGKKAIRVWRVA